MENRNRNPNPNRLSATTSIADLSNKELSEIFVRLPSYETVITCKFVSKRWLSLLSNPKFIIQFVKEKKKQQKALPWTILSTLRLKQIIDDDDDRHDKKEVQRLIDKHNKVFSSPKFSMNFLPLKLFKVAATFKDLVLCMDVSRREDDDHRLYYYICNPVTKRWVALPPTPSHYDRARHQDRSLACLICEDPYKDEKDGIDNYRFRVVVVSNPTKRLGRRTLPYDPFVTLKEVSVFCSENFEWVDIDVRVPLNPTLGKPVLPLRVALCEGMVCLCYYLYFGTFNPFQVVTCTTNTTIEARVLPIPYSLNRSQNSKLLECGGRLISVLATPMVSYRRDEEYNLLVDKAKGVSVSIVCDELHLKQVVVDNNGNELSHESWREMGYRSMCIDKTAKSLSILSGIRMISIHPRNDQLLYILTATNELLLCDTGSSRLITLGRPESLPLLRSSNKRLELQYWPTPVPTILGSQSKTN